MTQKTLSDRVVEVIASFDDYEVGDCPWQFIPARELIRDMQARIGELEADLRPAQILLQKYSVEIAELEEENAKLRDAFCGISIIASYHKNYPNTEIAAKDMDDILNILTRVSLLKAPEE